MKIVLFSLLFLLSVLNCQAGVYQRTVTYNDEVLVRCPANMPSVKELLESDEVDVWQIYADGMADVRMKKDLLEGTHEKAKSQCTVVANVEELVRQFENKTSVKGRQDVWFEEYHQYEEIVQWYKNLCAEDKCQYFDSIGKSYEGRDQPAVHIGSGPLNVYFQCQIHAREWISGATCMYIASYFIENSNEDRVKNILEKVTIIIVPFVNPDGYEYTWTGDRLWRKNRQMNSGSTCRGVDLNRNYNDHWNEGGSSSNPCSETYHGTGAASEPETQNTQRYFKANAPIIAAIDWHSYSQLILRPYGWTSANCPDEARLSAIGAEMRAAIMTVHGEAYTSQKSIGLYPTSGTASDWFYGDDATSGNGGYRAAGYTIELRDRGQYGFLLPASQIIPTGDENVVGVLAFLDNIIADPLRD